MVRKIRTKEGEKKDISYKKELLKRQKAKKRLQNLTGGSLLWRFNISYIIFSLLPVLILVYLYYQYDPDSRTIRITEDHFSLLILLVSVGCLVSFFGVRNALKKLFILTSRLKEYMFGELDKKTVLELARDEGEVAELAKAFGDILNRLEANIHELKHTKKTLHRILFNIGQTLNFTENLSSLLRLTLEAVVDALSAMRGAIYLFNPEKHHFELSVVIGLSENEVSTEIDFGQGPLGLVAKEKKLLSVPFVEESKKGNDLFDVPLVCVPLVSHGKLLGAVVLSGKRGDDNFLEEEVKILSNLATQIAVSIKNAKLNVDIESAYLETISSLALAAEAKDRYSQGHSERVAEISVEIGRRINLGDEDIKTLRNACKLHDIGKIGIEDNILQKPGQLSNEEMKEMHKHPSVGESIIKPLKSLKNLLAPIRQHHEKLDGTGYPRGLKGDEISVIARILAVADIFDALTTNRPYRKALSYKVALSELDKLANDGKLDVKIIGILKEVVS